MNDAAKNPDQAAAGDGYHLGYTDDVVHKLSQRAALREGSFLLPFLRPGMSLLDAGCGPGSITLDLARLLAPGVVTGIDVDAGQVALADATARQAKIDNVRFLPASIYELPFADESFDAVFSHTVFMHLSRPEAAMRELFRVCKRGGLIGVREGLGSFGQLSSVTTNGVTRTFPELMQEISRVSGGRPDIGMQLKGMLHAAGFRGIKPGTFNEVYHEPDDLRMLQSWFESLLGGSLGDRAVEAGVITRAGLAELLAAMRGWPADPAAISVVSWIHYVGWKR